MTKHVLVIDDDFGNRMLPGLFLRDMGYVVTECSSAEEAYFLIAQYQFSDVLLDISLPNVSGLEIFRVLREKFSCSEQRIIAYTAHAMPEEVKSFSDLGFDGLLIKPICKADLVNLFD